MPKYLQEVRAELRHVNWPTRQQAIVYTIVVMLISLATAVYLGVWDYILAELLKRII